MYKYEIIIYWSREDQCFIADIPELPGCIAHGATNAEALKNANLAITLWIETAKDFGDEIPIPKEKQLLFA